MCRLLAYTGPEISLHNLISNTEHNLHKQAWQPREMREATLNADGFGIGWDNEGPVAARYRQSIPIWNDPNLADFSHSLQRKLWLAMVRSATPGLGAHHDNTQPFRYQNWLFMHNGYIADFAQTARGEIRNILHHDFENNIHGNTDSEYIFALLLHFIHQHNDTALAIKSTMTYIADIIGKHSALLNIMLCDGNSVYATCHAINGLCPTLYYGKNITGFPEAGQLLASEALNNDRSWQAVEDHQLIILQPDNEITLQAL
ncbi:MAG TPA: ergothioneine biosynthesis protein EgtC [Gammaproteobacteria bacterium]